MKDYLRRKFKNVAGIATYTFFKNKGVIKDAARVLGVPYADVQQALKTVEVFEDFEQSVETAAVTKKVSRRTNLGIGTAWTDARHWNAPQEGLLFLTSLCISILQLKRAKSLIGKQQSSVTAYDMDEVAKIGLIKFDLLGLKTLSVIQDAVDMINDRHGIEVDLHSIDLDDKNVMKMLSNGYTQGGLQAEAAPFTALLKKMVVTKFDHIVAANALVRPGAMDAVGETFIARQAGKEVVPQIHPIYDEITEDSVYGLCIMQEQTMLLCNKLAGMSWSDADKIRKIIGKKKDVHEFDQFKDAFVTGASKHVPVEFADKLWTDFEKSSNYSFNKSHSVAYSMLTVWTAWLKHYYPLEFMCAALSNEDKVEKKTDYFIEAKRLGIKILMPHVEQVTREYFY